MRMRRTGATRLKISSKLLSLARPVAGTSDKGNEQVRRSRLQFAATLDCLVL